ALLNLSMDETSFDAWRYLCGEPVITDHRRELDVASTINNDEKALKAFHSLRILLAETDHDVLCILIDEFEALEVVPSIKKQRILNGIRRIIDMNPQGLCIVLACAPEAWSSIIREYHAFSERIFREIVLKPLDQRGIEELVLAYLNHARSKGSRRPGTSQLFPFSD